MKRFDYKECRITEHNLHIVYEDKDKEQVTISVPKSGLLYRECLMHPELTRQPIYGEYVTVALPQVMQHRVTQRITAHLRVFIRYVYDPEFDKWLVVEPAEAIAARIVHANYIPLS